MLTYKGARVDEESGSKPEHETRVEDAEAVHAVLRGLGYVPAIACEKRCRNYDLDARGRQMLATLVRVPEVEGRSWSWRRSPRSKTSRPPWTTCGPYSPSWASATRT